MLTQCHQREVHIGEGAAHPIASHSVHYVKGNTVQFDKYGGGVGGLWALASFLVAL